MKYLCFTFLFCCFLGNVRAQEVGEVREVQLILEDIPFSGDAIQSNFISADSTELFSFNHMDWLDKHVSLYRFFHTYRDSCFEMELKFDAVLIYIPMEQFEHKRYEGYLPTGETLNQWVLTSIVRKEEELD